MSLTTHVTENQPPSPPTTCPFCRSLEITTASKNVDSSAYWRCQTCGEIWNVDRLRMSQRHGAGSGW